MTSVRPGRLALECVEILGVPVAKLSMAQALARLEGFLESGQPHLVVTADASGIAQAQTDSELMALYQEADLVTPDSFGVLWAARRKGVHLTERVSGVDLVAELCRRACGKGWRIYLLGAAPGVAELAAERLRSNYPGCQIVGTHDGYFSPDRDQEVAALIAKTDPDILFVAMGIPRQEKFIQATQSTIRASVAIGVGGTLDVLSGRVRRAPVLVQKLKLEWLWRTLSNPKKIRKALNLPKFVLNVVRSGR